MHQRKDSSISTSHGNWLKLQEKAEGSVRVEDIKEDDRLRHKITGIIRLEDGLGVECLKGSGLIADETSRGYDDIFTITLAIGAYLVRLGECAVQVEDQPFILTGAPVPNKVPGREVYTSNLQLDGTQIKHKNGVSHLTAGSNLKGTQHMLQRISYVPVRDSLSWCSMPRTPGIVRSDTGLPRGLAVLIGSSPERPVKQRSSGNRVSSTRVPSRRL